ncbi:MAG TPA: hypothetical protein VFI65_16180 [Streptosporangiaceae bacterium]|nr:hypothetical protein [Streptosporangiaceae bacterium]
MPRGDLAGLIGREALPRAGERLRFAADTVGFAVAWLALAPAAIAVSGFFINKIPACRLWPRGRVFFALTLFALDACIFGLTVRQPIQIFFQRVGLDIGQLDSIGIFSAFSSAGISFLAFMIYQSAIRLRRMVDPISSVLDAKYAEIGARRQRYQHGYENEIIPPSLGKR